MDTHGAVVNYASSRLQDSKTFMLNVVSHDKSALGLASERLRDDDAFIIEAVVGLGALLSYASARLKDHAAFMQHILMQKKMRAVQMPLIDCEIMQPL